MEPMLPFYLAAKEIVRNKSRFFAVCGVIGLITLLVLFIAALGEGLAQAGKQYIENLDAELLVYQEGVDFSIPASRLGRGTLNSIGRVPGVAAVGPLGFSVGAVLLGEGDNVQKVDVSLIGVEPGLPGAPIVFAGQPLISRRANEVVLDQNFLAQNNIPIGETIQLRVTQGTEEKIYKLVVVGHTTGKQYSFLPGLFVPMLTWDKIRPQGEGVANDLVFNVAAVRLENAAEREIMGERIASMVRNVEATDLVTAYEAVPGYTAQQSTVNTQKGFTLLIAVLVIGGFFQIQTLQKVGQIGMLKAIGASNWLVGVTLVAQVVLTTIIGITLGGTAAWLLSLALPPGIPIQFQGPAIVTAVVSLLAIGPIGGLVSVRTLLKVEPLTALGLG